LNAFELAQLPVVVLCHLIHPEQRRRNLSASRLDRFQQFSIALPELQVDRGSTAGSWRALIAWYRSGKPTGRDPTSHSTLRGPATVLNRRPSTKNSSFSPL